MRQKNFLPMLKKEIHEQYSTYRALIAVIILLLMGLSAPIVTKLTPELLKNLGDGIKIEIPPQTAIDALHSYIGNMLQLPPLMLILIAMGCIADERSRGTAVTVLTKPVSRTIFVLSKFLTYSLTVLIGIALAAAGAYLYTTQLFSVLPTGGFLLLNLAILIFFLLVLAVTILTSVLLRNAVAAGGLACVGFIALSILPNINASIAKALPSHLFSVNSVIQMMGGTLSLPEILWPLGLGVGLTLALLALACFIFQRQEI